MILQRCSDAGVTMSAGGLGGAALVGGGLPEETGANGSCEVVGTPAQPLAEQASTPSSSAQSHRMASFSHYLGRFRAKTPHTQRPLPVASSACLVGRME